MPSLFEHVPHPRIAQRQAAGPPKVADGLPSGNIVARMNTRFGLAITVAVGSMWAAYLFTLLALVSLPSAIKSHDKIIIVSWIAQTFLQLVLLPIIIVGHASRAKPLAFRTGLSYHRLHRSIFNEGVLMCGVTHRGWRPDESRR